MNPNLCRYDMTLTEYLRTVGCQSQRVAMVIVAQLLEGVSHLVANGVAHRDLKGNNILVNLDPGETQINSVYYDVALFFWRFLSASSLDCRLVMIT